MKIVNREKLQNMGLKGLEDYLVEHKHETVDADKLFTELANNKFISLATNLLQNFEVSPNCIKKLNIDKSYISWYAMQYCISVNNDKTLVKFITNNIHKKTYFNKYPKKSIFKKIIGK